MTRTALKESLLESQGHLCAYCMRRIDDADHVKLEHLYPQSLSISEGHPEQTVDYSNMLVSCMGGSDERGVRMRLRRATPTKAMRPFP